MIDSETEWAGVSWTRLYNEVSTATFLPVSRLRLFSDRHAKLKTSYEHGLYEGKHVTSEWHAELKTSSEHGQGKKTTNRTGMTSSVLESTSPFFTASCKLVRSITESELCKLFSRRLGSDLNTEPTPPETTCRRWSLKHSRIHRHYAIRPFGHGAIRWSRYCPARVADPNGQTKRRQAGDLVGVWCSYL